MDKRQLSKKKFELLRTELSYWETQQVLSAEQVTQITTGYEIKSNFNFIRMIILLGSVLVGLGILSFIASNWQEMSKLAKFLLIIGSFLGFNFAGYRLEDTFPRIGRSLVYIGVFIYGAGIFLIGQMFNFGGHFSNAFMFWALGILPMAVLLRDKIIFIFLHVLLLIYVNGSFDLHQYPYLAILVTPALYYFNRYFDHAKLITFCNNLLALNLLGYTFTYNNISQTWLCLTFFAIGLVFFIVPIPYQRLIFKLQGLLLIGIFGLVLTIPEVWEAIHVEHINIYFALAYLVLLLALIRNGNLVALLFFCLTIFRFYVDTFYDFMPKSLFFVVGGGMLLAFGYYFERKRQVQGGLGYEK